MKNVGKFLMLVFLSLFFSGCVHSARQGENEQGIGEQAKVQVEGRFVKGEQAPKVVAESFSGSEVDISEYYGEKAVVLDFWAGWCPFCIEEMPELQKAQDRYRDDLVVIGVHRTDTESVDTGKGFAVEREVEYPLVKDVDGSLYRASGGIGMPVAVFIDRKGIVQEIKSGPKTVEEIEKKVEDLL